MQWTITSNSIRRFSPSSFHCIFILTEQRLLILILQFAEFLKSNSKSLMNILKLHFMQRLFFTWRSRPFDILNRVEQCERWNVVCLDNCKLLNKSVFKFISIVLSFFSKALFSQKLYRLDLQSKQKKSRLFNDSFYYMISLIIMLLKCDCS